jgi:hypothetical protein
MVTTTAKTSIATEHGILFSAPMVRALLDGRKTQTRRALRHQVTGPAAMQMTGPRHAEIVNKHGVHIPGWDCPYGQPGDRLWVRETTHRRPMLNLLTGEPLAPEYDGGAYTVDGVDVLTPDGFDVAWWYSRSSCPSIHMPRWACRILLEISGVRVERLQAIGEADARAEGVTIEDHHMRGYCAGEFLPPSIRAYRDLWESINGVGSWEGNPWVWVVEFKRVAS